MINTLLVPVAVFVLARSSAEWIPPVSDKIGSVVDQRFRADGKQRLRDNDEAMKELHEERVGSPPHFVPQVLASFMRSGESSVSTLAPTLESSMLSLTRDKSIAEPLSATLNVPNKLDVSHLRSNDAFTQRMEELRINIDDVVAGVQRLREKHEYFIYDEKNLIMMSFGSLYFDKLEQSGIKFDPAHVRVIRASDKFTDAEKSQFDRWKAGRRYSPLKTNHMPITYAKIMWLAYNEDFKMSLVELADMAFGSELIPAHEIITPPKSETLDQLNHLIEKLTSRHDVDLKVKEKLQTFAEDSSYIGKTEEELLKRAEVAAFDDELMRNKQKVDHLKEDNKVFTQRMEKLRINIDDVVARVQTLPRTHGLENYNEYSLTLMALGFEYFKTIKGKFGRLSQVTLAYFMGEYAYSQRFNDWKTYRLNSHVPFQNVYAKMRWLKQAEDLNMKDEELADMAFGSEFFILHQIKQTWSSWIHDEDKVETLDQLERLINQQPEADKRVRKLDVKGKLREMAKKPDSFIGKTAKELIKEATHEAIGDVYNANKRRRVA